MTTISVVLAVLILSASRQQREPAVAPGRAEAAVSDADHGFLYGRITTEDGATYEGRLRFGGDEEAFWGDYFNGAKDENPWIAHAQAEQLTESRPITVFGLEIGRRTRRLDLDRPFMARFGDIVRIEARGRHLWVTLKSGTVFSLNRYGADDLADGLRVWDKRRGVVDLDEWGIRTIEFLPTAAVDELPKRLHGTVQTPQGKFTGFLQWNRERGVSTDEFTGRTAEGERRFRFDGIRSIERESSRGSLVTLVDGSEIALVGTSEVGEGKRGIYIDDPRYGRVLVSWDAFERVNFSPGGGGPAYGDFPQGLPLTGSITTRAGHRLTGRLVYDLDESETTETLDAPADGVDYTIPFGLIASIVAPEAGSQASVILNSGESLRLERAGDLGDGNAGMLIFVDNRARPEYVRWTDIERIDFDRPLESFPPLERH